MKKPSSSEKTKPEITVKYFQFITPDNNLEADFFYQGDLPLL